MSRLGSLTSSHAGVASSKPVASGRKLSTSSTSVTVIKIWGVDRCIAPKSKKASVVESLPSRSTREDTARSSSLDRWQGPQGNSSRELLKKQAWPLGA